MSGRQINISDADIARMLEKGMPDTPPEKIVNAITPWKKAVTRILTGTALCTVTVNLLYINCILSAAGTVMVFLGFRSLKNENKWFRTGYIVAAVRMVLVISGLIADTWIGRPDIPPVIDFSVAAAVILINAVCIWKGMECVRRKAGQPPRLKAGMMLVIWYVAICVLAAVEYAGMIVSVLMVAVFLIIVRTLYVLARETEKAGYAVTASAVKISDRAVAAAVVLILAAGLWYGFTYLDSYPMNWTERENTENAAYVDIRKELLDKGFPENVLDDLDEEEIRECRGAERILTDSRKTLLAGSYYDENGKPAEDNMIATEVCVKLPGTDGAWKVFVHFEWKDNTEFGGTEALRVSVSPADENSYRITCIPEDISGKVLYDKDGKTYISDYHMIGTSREMTEMTGISENTSSSLFGFESAETEGVCGAFSMPEAGKAHRGYISFTVKGYGEKFISSDGMEYYHQWTTLQYPVKTALDSMMSGNLFGDDAFRQEYVSFELK